AVEAKAQCATSCATIPPKHPVLPGYAATYVNESYAKCLAAPDSSACFVSRVQHLVVPRDTHALQFAYGEVNRD
ncbi:MAG TPA: hypothetical protein VEU33_10165, partial [Archangium sp.]|nr:hypothetical protein [Archangium sp.]